MRKIVVGAWIVAGLSYGGKVEIQQNGRVRDSSLTSPVLGDAEGAGSPASGWSWQNPLPHGGPLGVSSPLSGSNTVSARQTSRLSSCPAAEHVVLTHQ